MSKLKVFCYEVIGMEGYGGSVEARDMPDALMVVARELTNKRMLCNDVKVWEHRTIKWVKFQRPFTDEILEEVGYNSVVMPSMLKRLFEETGCRSIVVNVIDKEVTR